MRLSESGIVNRFVKNCCVNLSADFLTNGECWEGVNRICNQWTMRLESWNRKCVECIKCTGHTPHTIRFDCLQWNKLFAAMLDIMHFSEVALGILRFESDVNVRLYLFNRTLTFASASFSSSAKPINNEDHHINGSWRLSLKTQRVTWNSVYMSKRFGIAATFASRQLIIPKSCLFNKLQSMFSLDSSLVMTMFLFIFPGWGQPLWL